MLRNFGRLAPAQKRRAVLLCALPLLCLAAAGAAVAAAFSAGRAQAPQQVPAAPQQTYEQRQYEQQVAEFSDAFLRETEDAGEEYLQESLFVGDSNTVRLAGFGEIEMNNMAGSVGLGVQSVPTKACIWFREYAEPVTMAKAAALLQPRRMIVMFGTNNTDMQPGAFLEAYEQALESLEAGYPYADIIIAAVPPVGAGKTDAVKVQKRIDAFNLALAAFAEENGYPFLNSAEALKGSDGYMKTAYVEEDGMHFTARGAAAFVQYVRTHSYDAQDRRPELKPQPTRKNEPYAPSSSSQGEAEEAPQPTETPEPTETPQPAETPLPAETPPASAPPQQDVPAATDSSQPPAQSASTPLQTAAPGPEGTAAPESAPDSSAQPSPLPGESGGSLT